MQRFSFLWAGAYFVALVLVITPVIDVTMATLPFRPAELIWRFAAIGIIAEGVMTALLGLLIALVVAAFLGHRELLRVLGVVSGLGSLAFVGVIGLFLVEGMAVRSLVAEDVEAAMDVASVVAFLKHVSGAVGTGLMALAARNELKILASRVE